MSQDEGQVSKTGYSPDRSSQKKKPRNSAVPAVKAAGKAIKETAEELNKLRKSFNNINGSSGIDDGPDYVGRIR